MIVGQHLDMDYYFYDHMMRVFAMLIFITEIKHEHAPFFWAKILL